MDFVRYQRRKVHSVLLDNEFEKLITFFLSKLLLCIYFTSTAKKKTVMCIDIVIHKSRRSHNAVRKI